MYFDFLDPEASIRVTPVPPSRSPSTLSSFIEESTPHASPSMVKQDFPWDPSYNAEILPHSSPPPTLEIEALPSDEDNDNELNVCNGQLIEWTPGPVWDTYAYGSHASGDDSVGWTPTGFEGSTHIRLQSMGCSKFLKNARENLRGSCASCYSILNSAELQRFKDRSTQDIFPNTPGKFLTARQFKQLRADSRKNTNKLHNKVVQSIFMSIAFIKFFYFR